MNQSVFKFACLFLSEYIIFAVHEDVVAMTQPIPLAYYVMVLITFLLPSTFPLPLFLV